MKTCGEKTYDLTLSLVLFLAIMSWAIVDKVLINQSTLSQDVITIKHLSAEHYLIKNV